MKIDPIYIRKEDVKRKFSWSEAVNVLREGHRFPQAEIGDLFLGPADATLLNRAAFIPKLGYAMKSVSVFGGNSQVNLPTVQGAMLLFEPENGQLLAVLESAVVTEIKTAADSILGAKFLARPESKTLLIVGAGAVAASLVEAYSAYFENLDQVLVWARRFEASEKLAQKYRHLNVRAVEDLATACAQADIISTATMAREPILKGAWIKHGTHVDLIGAFKADMREADDDLISGGRLFVDSKATTIEHIVELKIPISKGVIDQTAVLGDFYDLELENVPARVSDEDVTIFKNGGGAHLDLMIARYLFGLAQ